MCFFKKNSFKTFIINPDIQRKLNFIFWDRINLCWPGTSFIVQVGLIRKIACLCWALNCMGHRPRGQFTSQLSIFHMQNNVSLGKSHLSGQVVNSNIYLLNSVENGLCRSWDQSSFDTPCARQSNALFIPFTVFTFMAIKSHILMPGTVLSTFLCIVFTFSSPYYEICMRCFQFCFTGKKRLGTIQTAQNHPSKVYMRVQGNLGFYDSNLSLNTFPWAFETRT